MVWVIFVYVDMVFGFYGFFSFNCLDRCSSMIVSTPAVLSVLYACVLCFYICTCSAQLSMFHMERRSRNTLIIIIVIVIFMCSSSPHFQVGVHIADVSHFIRPNTAIDREAANRGTTVYLTDQVSSTITTVWITVCNITDQVFLNNNNMGVIPLTRFSSTITIWM